jgi:outer membrane receptor protein involved in Fe transport
MMPANTARALLPVLCAATVVTLPIVGPASAQITPRETRTALNIAPQKLEAALRALSHATGLHIVYVLEDVESRHTHGAVGRLTPDEALRRILQGTGLTYRQLDDSSVTILPVDPARLHGDPRTVSGNSELDRRQVQQPPPELDEVLVTSTKLQQPARTVAGSIAVVGGAQLDEIGAQGFADYLSRVPGVVFNGGPPGLSTATIRGVSTTTTLDQGQGTTGYYINEVPLTDPNFPVSISDIDTFDVDNIAVMRGPQGTLFGSASLGGAINYQAAAPDTTAFHARLQGTFATVARGADNGSGKAMVNVPLITDKLAFRGVFVYRDDGGYIDNFGTGVNNSNRTLIRGGRAELLWTPAEGTRVSYLFLRQGEDTADLGYQEPNVAGELRKKTFIAEPLNLQTTLNNLRLDQDLGFATLTATGTHHEKAQSSNYDFTPFVGGLFDNQLAPIYAPQSARSNGTTFEIRLASPPQQRFTYLVGAMRDVTREFFLDNIGARGAQQYATTVYDPTFGAGFGAHAVPNDVLYAFTLGATGEERALFGEGQFHFTEHWALTLGGRLFDTQVSGSTSAAGLLYYLLTEPNVLRFSYANRERARGFSPKASLTWTVNPDLMVYALASKGFRFGGPNLNPPDPKNPFPPTYAPDTLWNYELGTRTSWLDRRLQLDTTLFYIDWRNIQVRLGTATGLAYATNFGRAGNYGIENTLLWRPDSQFTLQTGATYLNATLRQPVQFGAATAPAGSTLPGASKWTLSAVTRYQLQGVPLRPAIVLSDRFISTAPANFGQVMPLTERNYNLLDARLSAYIKGVEATLFMDNITDRLGVTNITYPAGIPLEQYIVQPRTVGVTLDYRY